MLVFQRVAGSGVLAAHVGESRPLCLDLEGRRDAELRLVAHFLVFGAELRDTSAKDNKCLARCLAKGDEGAALVLDAEIRAEYSYSEYALIELNHCPAIARDAGLCVIILAPPVGGVSRYIIAGSPASLEKRVAVFSGAHFDEIVAPEGFVSALLSSQQPAAVAYLPEQLKRAQEPFSFKWLRLLEGEAASLALVELLGGTVQPVHAQAAVAPQLASVLPVKCASVHLGSAGGGMRGPVGAQCVVPGQAVAGGASASCSGSGVAKGKGGGVHHPTGGASASGSGSGNARSRAASALPVVGTHKAGGAFPPGSGSGVVRAPPASAQPVAGILARLGSARGGASTRGVEESAGGAQPGGAGKVAPLPAAAAPYKPPPPGMPRPKAHPRPPRASPGDGAASASRGGGASSALRVGSSVASLPVVPATTTPLVVLTTTPCASPHAATAPQRPAAPVPASLLLVASPGSAGSSGCVTFESSGQGGSSLSLSHAAASVLLSPVLAAVPPASIAPESDSGVPLALVAALPDSSVNAASVSHGNAAASAPLGGAAASASLSGDTGSAAAHITPPAVGYSAASAAAHITPPVAGGYDSS